MTYRHFKQTYQNFIFCAFAGLLLLAAKSTTEEVVGEKRIGVVMRMIGHEMLKCLGDEESRILPIEKINAPNKPQSYRIPFEFEFGFDPDDIISIVGRVMTESGVTTDYMVEVEQCETKAVVHNFTSNMAPCRGRVLPKDCYSLIVTIFDSNTDLAAEALSADDPSVIASEFSTSNLFKSTYLIIPLLILIGFMGYFSKQKPLNDNDPNLISIGASQFDKRNMSLIFENQSIELSNKEAELLTLLHTSANLPVEREVILQNVWGDEGNYVGRTLDVFISKLRKKLEADASVKIVNIRGVGYKLVMEEAG